MRVAQPTSKRSTVTRREHIYGAEVLSISLVCRVASVPVSTFTVPASNNYVAPGRTVSSLLIRTIGWKDVWVIDLDCGESCCAPVMPRRAAESVQNKTIWAAPVRGEFLCSSSAHLSSLAFPGIRRVPGAGAKRQIDV